MTAQLATISDRILAHLEDPSAVPDSAILPSGTSEKLKIDGVEFDSGYLSPFFITDPVHMEVAFENAYILVSEGTISSRKDLLPLLEQIAKSGRPMLIVAEDVTGEALATLVVKKLRGDLHVAAVRAPGLGDQRKRMLHYIALFTGGKTTSEGIEIQLCDMQIADLGQAKRITVGQSHTCIATLQSRDPLQRMPINLVTAAGVPPEFDS
jgi:chaperonin GroEL